MAGSNIFVIYSDGHGNVTLSPRHGAGHFEPETDTQANVTLLEGSGVKGGMMIANILCANCNRWNGGSTDFTGSSGDWVHASLPGDPLDSTKLDEEIQEHNDHGSFTWAYSTAQGGQDVNPFVSRVGSNGVSSPPQTNGGSSQSSVSNDDNEPGEASNTMITAHGAVASVTFLVLFPVGAIIIRILKLSPWVHAGLQIFAYCCFIAAAGLGIYIATLKDLLTNHHPIIGMILLGLVTFQPFAGVLHHSSYKKTQRRTFVSQFHIWEGRLVIVLGMINGGLGLKLFGVKTGYQIAYGVVAGVMGLACLTAIVFGESKRRVGDSEKPASDPSHGHM